MPSKMPSVSKDFQQRIHMALRNWHQQHTKHTLHDLLLAEQSPPGQAPTHARTITNRILEDALDQLRSVDASASDLLQQRFRNREKAQAIAYRLNTTEDVVYHRQRAAIIQLARIVWHQELALRQASTQTVELQLGAPSYTRLYGFDTLMQQASELISVPQEPWILSVEGMGGSGKTAFTDALVRHLTDYAPHYRVVWLTVRPSHFQPPNRFISSHDTDPDDIDALLDRLLSRLGQPPPHQTSTIDKLASARAQLKTDSYLVVLDGVEAMSHDRGFVHALSELTKPSKLLLTTRHSLQGQNGTFILKIPDLSANDTLALIRTEAAVQGLQTLVLAQDTQLMEVYRATGGNPLAVKSIISDAHVFSLSLSIGRLSAATETSAESLLDYIHSDGWQRLDSVSRRVLVAMSTNNTYEGINEIAQVCQVDELTAASSLYQLANLNLVSVAGDVTVKKYSLHPLTRAFAAQQGTDA